MAIFSPPIKEVAHEFDKRNPSNVLCEDTLLKENEEIQHRILDVKPASNSTLGNILLWGAGCSLGVYLKHILIKRGYQVLCFSEGRKIDDEIPSGLLLGLIWLRGLTRPNDKFLSFNEHLSYIERDLHLLKKRVGELSRIINFIVLLIDLVKDLDLFLCGKCLVSLNHHR